MYPDRLALALTADDIERELQERPDRLAARHGGRPRDRELARRSCGRTTPRCALHDADAQRHARLGRRGARLRAARRADRVRQGSRAGDESAGDAGRPVTRLARHDERRARCDRGAGDLLALRGPGAGGPSAERAGLDPGAPAEERRRGDGDFVPAFVSPEVAVWEARRAGRQAIDPTVDRHRRTETAATSGKRRTRVRPATLSQVADTSSTFAMSRGSITLASAATSTGSNVPVGLEDVSKFPTLFAELIRRGWSDADLKKLAGQNLLRASGRRKPLRQGSRRPESPPPGRSRRWTARHGPRRESGRRPITRKANTTARVAKKNHWSA